MSKKTKVCISAVSFLIGVLFFLIVKNDILIVLSSSKDIYNDPVDNISQLKVGTAVETSVPFTYGCILEGTSWTDRGDGVIYGSSQDVYYLIPIYDKHGEIYMTLIEANLDSSLHKQLKKLEKDSLNYSDGGTISVVEFKGGFYPINKDALALTKEIVYESGLCTEKSELDKYILPVCLRENNAVNGYVGSAVCGVSLLVAVLFLVLLFVGGTKNENGVSYNTREKELKELDDVTVKINGYDLKISAMQDVDRAIFEGNMEKAIKKLKSYRATQEEAERIAADWKNIARMN